MGEEIDKFHPLDPGYRYCPKCASPLDLRMVKPHEPKRLVCTGCGYIFYLDSKVAVGTVPFMQGRIILLRRAIEPGFGKWTFPGGFVDRGETLEEAAVRETKEEIGLEVELAGLLNAYSYRGRPVIVIVYEAKVTSGVPAPGEEALEVRLFSPEEIPWEELAFPSTRDALRDVLRKSRDPSAL